MIINSAKPFYMEAAPPKRKLRMPRMRRLTLQDLKNPVSVGAIAYGAVILLAVWGIYSLCTS